MGSGIGKRIKVSPIPTVSGVHTNLLDRWRSPFPPGFFRAQDHDPDYLAAMLRSRYATENQIENFPWVHPTEVPAGQNLSAIRPVVQRLAAAFAEAGFDDVIISSGFRAPPLNRGVRGQPNSFHQHGLAVDFARPGGTPADYRAMEDIALRIMEPAPGVLRKTFVHSVGSGAADHLHISFWTPASWPRTYFLGGRWPEPLFYSGDRFWKALKQPIEAARNRDAPP